MHELHEMTALFRRVAESAQADPETAAQVRVALAESGLIEVYGTGETLDVLDLLDAGGEAALRARLREFSLADLRALVSTLQYDPQKETVRWRSTAKFVELIVGRAKQQLEEERVAAQSTPLAAASWML